MLRPARGRHARPSALPSRVALTSALGGVLLPVAVSGAAPAAAAERAQSATRISGPRTTAPGTVTLSVRLLADERWVRNGVVEIQIPEGRGWRSIGRTSTNEQGLGRYAVRLTGDKRFRAHYRGNAHRTAATSSAILVDVQDRGARAVQEASRHRGKPYRYGATGPSSFDCSGFTQYVYKRVGVRLPRTSGQQERAVRRVSKSAARPGDLVFIKDVRGHVGIYAGNGRMWDAPRSGKTVTLRRIWTSNYTVGRV